MEKTKNKKDKTEEKSRGMIVLPYVGGLTEKLTRIFKKRRISTAVKPHTTLRSLLVKPKDKCEPREGVYTIDCQGCEGRYIGEIKRMLNTRVKEHRKEVEEVSKDKPFTTGIRRVSQKERWKSAITESGKMRAREGDWFVRLERPQTTST